MSHRLLTRVAHRLAPLVVASILFGACAPQPSTPLATSAPPATSLATEAPAAGVTEAPAFGRTDQKLVVTYDSEPSVFDFHAFGTHGDDDVRMNLLNHLVNRSIVEGSYPGTFIAVTGDYTPELAESWDLDESAKTLTWHLRRDVKFSNGDPMTADDVRFSFERSMKSPTSYVGLLFSMLTITDPAQIVVLDPYTIRFDMEKINPFIYELMAITVTGVTDKDEVLAHATADDPWATTWMKSNMIGSGPYVLTNFTSGVEYQFEPNPYYWDQSQFPRNGGIVIKVIPDPSARELLLESGDVDVVRGVPYKDIEALDASEGVKVLTYTSTDIRYISFNTKVPPFDNVLVRQAVSLAIPYQDIVETVWSGYATQLKSIIPEGMPTSDFSNWDSNTDFAKAKELLAQAGYPDGLEVTLFTEAEIPEEQATAVLIQDSLKKIGIEVTIEKLLTAAYSDRLFNQRDMPFFFDSWISFVNDPFYHFFFLSKCGMGTNYGDYCNQQVDTLIDEGMFETDLGRREEISHEIQQILAGDFPYIYLVQPDSVIAMRDNVQGWTQHPDLVARYYTLWK